MEYYIKLNYVIVSCGHCRTGPEHRAGRFALSRRDPSKTGGRLRCIRNVKASADCGHLLPYIGAIYGVYRGYIGIMEKKKMEATIGVIGPSNEVGEAFWSPGLLLLNRLLQCNF